MPGKPSLACYWRKHEIDQVAVLNNVSAEDVLVEFPLPENTSAWTNDITEILTGTRYRVRFDGERKVVDVPLPPYSFVWLHVEVVM